MKGEILILFVITWGGICARHHHRSDLCLPCAGSNPSRHVLPYPLPHPSNQTYCHSLYETHVRLMELKDIVSLEIEVMRQTAFDGDTDSIDESPFVFTYQNQAPRLAVVYNKLVYLHVVFKLLETHPKKSACAVATSAKADLLPFCYISSVMHPETVQSDIFGNICSEEGEITLNGCTQVQRFAYRVHRTGLHILHDVHRDIKHLRQRVCLIQ